MTVIVVRMALRVSGAVVRAYSWASTRSPRISHKSVVINSFILYARTGAKRVGKAAEENFRIDIKDVTGHVHQYSVPARIPPNGPFWIPQDMSHYYRLQTLVRAKSSTSTPIMSWSNSKDDSKFCVHAMGTFLYEAVGKPTEISEMLLECMLSINANEDDITLKFKRNGSEVQSMSLTEPKLSSVVPLGLNSAHYRSWTSSEAPVAIQII
ncbi:hypothetical protein FIBSPDRAFT_893205 [Athelia psychrophila]|uniref:Uncharacterized protein n=1 Tax=Athelia psychrophila TaxID=1759441 RepID=A0A166HFB2_9AGAM|nr:hypothetical protein FIBSPDRAFT_893205 [Fibularhizoctonia sp. CBS 109695]